MKPNTKAPLFASVSTSPGRISKQLSSFTAMCTYLLHVVPVLTIYANGGSC